MKIRDHFSMLMHSTNACFGLLVFALLGCGGGERTSDSTKIGGTDSAMPRDTSAGSTMAVPTGAPPLGATVAMVAEGDSIFRGLKAGAICYTCHGADANGTTLAPSLRDSTWLTGDGSFQFIQKRVTEGVPTPTPPYVAAMPPMGGAQLTPDQVKSVAAYVYAISHR